jgi:hypothetical protein
LALSIIAAAPPMMLQPPVIPTSGKVNANAAASLAIDIRP